MVRKRRPIVSKVSGKAKRVLVLPDAHYPHQDPAAMGCVFHAIEVWNPDEVVILGDWLDAAAFSAHSKRSFIETEGADFLETEVGPCNSALDRIQGKKDRPVVFLEGNHCNRIERAALAMGGDLGKALYKLASPERVLRHRVNSEGEPGTKRKNFTWVPYLKSWEHSHYKITKDLIAVHGWSIAKNAAKVHLDLVRSCSIVHGHCVPLDYEVLTGRGWVQLRDVAVGDTALSYTPTGMMWGPVKEKVEYSYTGEMAVFNHPDIRMRMTDLHHVYTADGRYIPVRDAIAQGVRVSDLPLYGAPCDRTPEDMPSGVGGISDSELRLLVAYCADGHKDKKQQSVRWHVSKQRKIDRLTQLIAEFETERGEISELEWSAPGKNGGRKTKKISRQLQLRLLELAPGKTLPAWLVRLSARQREVFLEELTLWDGSHLWENCRQFQSHKSEEIDLVQQVLAQHGIFASRRSNGKGLQWNVGQTSQRFAELSSLVEWETVTGEPVGCITTDYNNFVFRTPDGKVQVSGNTHRAQSYTGRDPLSNRILQAWSPGCLSRLVPIYMATQPSDWTHGFSMVYVGDRSWTNYSVPISKGECVLPGGQLVRC